jgi:plasmid stabilization system protein ParE
MKNFDVIWTKKAEYDLELIIEYIKLDSVQSAKTIFFEIQDQCNTLYVFPERNRVVPELQSIGVVKYREIIYKQWRIVYKIENKSVYILIVIDSSRDIEDLLFQRLLKNT